MRDILSTEVMIFVHHFPTHSIVWEVYETTYETMEETPANSRVLFFEGADGVIYMGSEPSMMRRERAEEYANVKDNRYQRFTVTEVK